MCKAIGKRTAASTRVFALRIAPVYELFTKPCFFATSKTLLPTGRNRGGNILSLRVSKFNLLIIFSATVPPITGSRKSVNEPCNPVVIDTFNASSYCALRIGSVIFSSSNHLSAPNLFNAVIARAPSIIV